MQDGKRISALLLLAAFIVLMFAMHAFGALTGAMLGIGVVGMVRVADRGAAEFVPASLTDQVVGLNPRQLEVKVQLRQPATRITLHWNYAVTDAGIVPGETLFGATNRLRIRDLTRKRTVFYAERDCVGQGVDALAENAFEGEKPPLTNYTDGTPVTTVAQIAYAHIYGPFPAGTYSITHELLPIITEFPTATAFICDFAVNYEQDVLKHHPRVTPVVKSVILPGQSVLTVPRAARAFKIQDTTLLSDVQIDGNGLTALAIEMLSRNHNLSLGTDWDAATTGNPLNMHLGGGHSVTVKFSASTDIQYTVIYLAVTDADKYVVGVGRASSPRSRRRHGPGREDDDEREDDSYYEGVMENTIAKYRVPWTQFSRNSQWSKMIWQIIYRAARAKGQSPNEARATAWRVLQRRRFESEDDEPEHELVEVESSSEDFPSIEPEADDD